MLYIGVDLGTSAVKLLLMRENGGICRIVSEEYPVFYPHPGWSEQKPEDWWKAVVKGIRELTEGFPESEIRGIGREDFILLLAKIDEIVDGVLDTAKVKAFRVPKGKIVEVYATTLHYAPCHTDPAKGFRVMVALPRLTNTDKPAGVAEGGDARYLRARNKWLLAHEESEEAKEGASVALIGVNIDLAGDI